MKLLLFTDSLGSGGAQRQLVGLAVLLQKRGYEVKVCTYYNIDFYKQYLDDNGVKNEIIPKAGNTKLRIWAVRKYFKKEQPDWVIAYQETPSLVACMAKMLNCKFHLIVSERNTTQTIGLNERVRFFLYHWVDAIVPNSYAQEKFLLKHYPWMKRKLKTIINFVELEDFSYVEKQKSNRNLIVVAATIWESKNTLGLIEASRILVERNLKFHIDWYGVITGYECYVERCKNLIVKYNLGNYISLLPKTKKIGLKYQKADFFCLPSFFEGTPNVICEAMASGKPIMCSNVCDNSKYVIDGENGVLFNPNDPDDIANCIARCISVSEVRYKRMCSSSRKIAEEKFSKEVFIDKYLKIFK